MPKRSLIGSSLKEQQVIEQRSKINCQCSKNENNDIVFISVWSTWCVTIPIVLDIGNLWSVFLLQPSFILVCNTLHDLFTNTNTFNHKHPILKLMPILPEWIKSSTWLVPRGEKPTGDHSINYTFSIQMSACTTVCIYFYANMTNKTASCLFSLRRPPQFFSVIEPVLHTLLKCLQSINQNTHF